MAIGIGTSNITLIIDGLIENYGTTIQCVAVGLINGNLQSNTSQLYTLYMKGNSTMYTVVLTAYLLLLLHRYTCTCMHVHSQVHVQYMLSRSS